MFHISRQTVRKALGFLEEQGVVRRVRGSGTYISYDRRENLERCNRIAVITTYVDSYIFPKIIQGIENVLLSGDIPCRFPLPTIPWSGRGVFWRT